MSDDSRRSPLRLVRQGIERAGAPIEILLDGRPVASLEAETVAAALTAAGHLALRKTVQGSPRGLYCGIGVCFDCRVTIDGRPGQRSCMTIVKPGMRIETSNQPATNVGATPVAQPREQHCAVLVLGAGPAGLAAANAASELGVEVVILDERPAAGGQYFKPLGESHRFRGGKPSDSQFNKGAELVKRVRSRGVRIFDQVTVWDAQARPGGGVVVRAVDSAGSISWTADKLIVAAGAYERSWPVPGWTLPGVMTTGAAQTLARSYRVAPGTRVLIAGNGPLNFQVAADLSASGVRVVAVAEAAQPVLFGARGADLAQLARTRPDLAWQGATYVAALRRRGVPLFYRHVLARVEGSGCAERAVIAALDTAGNVVGGSERQFEVGAVCTGYGFAPANEITRLIGCAHEIDSRDGTTLLAKRDRDMRTTIGDVFIAGDAGGIWGAHSALAQGAIAGTMAAKDLGGTSANVSAALARARQRLERETRFQTALARVFSMPELADRLASDDTIACRCESVTFGAIRREIERGAVDGPSIKRATRAGMGHCQGRYCSHTVARMLAARSGKPLSEASFAHSQAPIKPVAIDAIAMERPELLTPAPLMETNRRIVSQDRLGDFGTLIIGGGIIGLCTALELARSGEDVAVLERGDPHAQASGANAGNLHVQFQTFGITDFVSDAARASLSTLVLQRDSGRLWADFAKQIAPDIEVEICGGLMVADDEAGLARLERKVDLERKAGLDIEMLTGDAARALLPLLSPSILAASLSRDEGRINPLKASPAVLALALAAGARLYTQTQALGIERTDTGFVVQTERGTFSAKRLVNAAGAWAGSVAALVGESIPVRPNPIQMLVTEAAPAITYYLAHASRRLTLKQSANGNLLIGGGWKAVFDSYSKRMRASGDGFAGNLAIVRDMLPSLGHLLVIRSWAGVAFSTPPVIGESAQTPGLFHAVVQNGMTLGPVVGRITSDLILGHDPGYDLRPFLPRRFS